MRAFPAIALTGVVGVILFEILKILLAPVSVWLIALLGAALAVLLKVVMIAAIVVLSVVAIGVGVYIYRRSARSKAEA
jgi:hypothetical protein